MTYEIYDSYGTMKAVYTREEAEGNVLAYNRKDSKNRANYKHVGLLTKVLRVCRLKKSLEAKIKERSEIVMGLGVHRTIQEGYNRSLPKSKR